MVKLTKNVILILMIAQCQLPFWQLRQEMLSRYKQDITLTMCRHELQDYVEVRILNYGTLISILENLLFRLLIKQFV